MIVTTPVARMAFPKYATERYVREGTISFRLNVQMPKPPRPDMAQMLDDMGIESTYHRALALQRHVRDALAKAYVPRNRMGH